MIKRQLLLITFLSLYTSAIWGQNLKGNVGLEDSHRPNASKGNGGADIVDVDLFSGTASVNIPIYDYSVDGLNLGVALGYSAKGIRVDERAESVGLGWNLLAGGSITREVNGLEDEVTMPNTFADTTGDPLQGHLVYGADITYDTTMSRLDDMEHDIFNFSFAGRSLAVVFDRYNSNGDIRYQTYPNSEIKIRMITKDSSGAGYGNIREYMDGRIGQAPDEDILTFIVTDEQGNTFYFERGDYEFKHFEFTPGLFSPDSGTYYPTLKWNLVKIETYSGLEINYEYQQKYVDYLESVTEELHYRYSKQYLPQSSIISDPLQVKQKRWKGIKTHLSRIVYPNNVTLTFILDTNRCDCKGDFKIQMIDVANVYNANVRNNIRYVLLYEYSNVPKFGNSNTVLSSGALCNSIKSSLTSIPAYLNADSVKEAHLERGLRLRLTAIKRIGTDTSTQEPYYNFEYNTAINLPYRFSAQKDYYGYYNGATVVPHIRTNLYNLSVNDTIYSSIPYPANPWHHYDNTITVAQNSYDNTIRFGAFREHNYLYAQAGILKKIRNCSNGEVELEFQDYTLNNPDSSYGCIVYDQTGCKTAIDTALQGHNVNDGLCIRKIHFRDSFNTRNGRYTEYQFTNGQRFHRGGYCWYENESSTDTIYTNYFVGAHKYVNGSNHGFSNATVTQKNASTNLALSSESYLFSNLMYLDENNNLQSWLKKPTGRYWHTHPASMKLYRIGLLLQVEKHLKGNPVSRVNYSYEDVAQNFSLTNWKVYKGSWWPYQVIDHQRARVKTQTVKTYTGLASPTEMQSVDVSYTYTYDDSDNVKCITWQDSRDITHKEYRQYTYNYTDDWDDNTPGTIFQTMGLDGLQHLISTETWKFRSSTDSVLLNCTLRSPAETYEIPGLVATDAKLRFNTFYSTHLRLPLSSSTYYDTAIIDKNAALKNLPNTSSGKYFIRDTRYTRFDHRGNVIELKINDTDAYTSYIYDTRTLSKIAEVQNARFNDIAYTSFEGDYSNSSSLDYGKGNWVIDDGYISFSGEAMTGKYVYALEHSYNDIRSKTLAQDKKYIVTFWAKGLVMGGVYSGAGSYVSSLNLEQHNKVGDWALYTASFTPSGTGQYIKIEEPTSTYPVNTVIDEIRLHPADATMTSYTYKPLFGAASINSPTNYITYYEYDPFGRETVVRDMRGNIILKKDIVCGGTDDGTTGGTGTGTSNPCSTCNPTF